MTLATMHGFRFSLMLSAALMVAVPALAQEPEVQEPVAKPPVTEPATAEPIPVEAMPPAVVIPGPASEVPEPDAVAAVPAEWSPVPTTADGTTAYGLFLAGRLAGSRGEGETGAAYLRQAYGLTPEQDLVRDQAFLANLLSGDLDFAALATPTGEGVSPVLTEAGRLVSVVRAFAEDDADTALAILVERPIGRPHNRAGQLILPFVAASAGDVALATRAPSRSARDPASLVARHSRAVILENLRRFDEADADYQLLMAVPLGRSNFTLAYGEFMERRGRRADAVALYDAALAEVPGDRRLSQARARAAARRRPPAVPTLREGAAQALSAAAALSTAEGAHEFAAVYLRLAISVDPDDGLRLALGAALGQADLQAASRAVFATVSPADPILYSAARTQMAMSWQQEDQPDAALSELRLAVEAAPEQAEIAYMLAAQLFTVERYDEALEILNGPLLNTADQGFEIHFLRGAAYESRGDVVLAENALWAALQMRPDDPTVLNYLGYLWVDSGRRVDQGAEMIARAHAADPQSGNIQDSLGWAQYRQGQYEIAVQTLEQAVDKEPANAEINDHLGDAYWQVGRRREATFQWNRVLTLEPDDQRRSEVEKKLAEGLTPPTPVSDGARP